jgi:hypothetical protein
VRRHDIDAVSLVAGALFIVVAIVHFSAGATDTELKLHWVVPALLVMLGVVGLLGALRGNRGEDTLQPLADDAPTEVLPDDEGEGRS